MSESKKMAGGMTATNRVILIAAFVLLVAAVGYAIWRDSAASAPPKPADAADAVALAMCHLWRAPAIARIEQAQQRRDLAVSRAQARARAAERRRFA